MPTIDTLDFKLIVDDTSFNATIQAAIQNAQLLNTQLTDLLNLQQQVVNGNNNVNAAAVNSLQQQLAALQQMVQAMQNARQGVDDTSRSLDSLGQIVPKVFSVDTLISFTKQLVEITGQFEVQRMAMTSILGEVSASDVLFERVKGLAVQSPYTMQQLLTFTKQLSSFSIPKDELFQTTKMLADVASGLGVDMGRIVLAFGQIRSAAFLRGQEVRQLTEAGIPIIAELQKKFEKIEGHAVSMGDVFDKISKKQVSFDMVRDVFKEMTSEGGKFYDMQNVLADTLYGQVQKVKDAYQIMLSELGEKSSPLIKSILQGITDMLRDTDALKAQMLEFVIITSVLNNGALLFGKNIGVMKGNLTVLQSVFKGIWGILSSNPWAIAVAAVAALAIHIHNVRQEQDLFQKAIDKAHDTYYTTFEKEIAGLDSIYLKLKSAKEGTEEYDAAKTELYRKYSSYISQLQQERVDITNLTTLYDNLRLKIEATTKARVGALAKEGVEDAFARSIDEIQSGSGVLKAFSINLNTLSKRIGLTASETQALWGYINGSVSAETLNSMKGYEGLLERVNNAQFRNGVATESGKDWVETMKKQFADAKDQYASATAAIEEFYGTIADEVYEPYNPDINPPKDKISDQIKALKDKATLVEKIHDLYKKMEGEFSNDQIRDFLADAFDFVPVEIRNNTDFKGQIMEIIETLEGLGSAGQDAARDLKTKMGDTLANEMVDTAKNAEKAKLKLQELLESFSASGNLQGSAAVFNVSKIVQNYDKEIAKIEAERRARLKEWATSTSKYDLGVSFGELIDQINNDAKDKTSDALAKANEAIRKQAEVWVENWDGFKSVDLSRFSDMTVNELHKVRNGIAELRKNPLKGFNADVLAELEKAGISVEVLENAINDYLNTLGDKTTEQMRKVKTNEIKRVASSINDIANAIRQLGEAGGFSTLLDLSDTLSKVVDFSTKQLDLANGLSDAYQKMRDAEDIEDPEERAKAIADAQRDIRKSQAEIFGSVLTYVAQGWLNAVSAMEQYKQTLIDIENEMLRAKRNEQLALGVDSIFGTDTYASLRNAGAMIGELQSEMDGLQKTLSGISISTKKAKWWEFFLAPTAPVAWAKLFTSQSMSVIEAMDEVGASLTDANGRINIDALKSIRDGFDGFSKAEKEAFDKAIIDAEAYNAALDQLDDTMGQLMGSVGQDFASAIVDQWKAAGDAVADYADLLDGLATQYAEMLIQNVLLEKIFDDDFKKKVTDLTMAKDAEGVMGLFDRKIDELEEYYPTFEQILEGLDKYFVKGDETASSTLSGGIKSITEETAGLLASYVNAIRADVAAIREGGMESNEILKQLFGLFPQSPTLADYLMQIQANTFNTAEATQSILASIASMTTDNGGPALRVMM